MDRASMLPYIIKDRTLIVLISVKIKLIVFLGSYVKHSEAILIASGLFVVVSAVVFMIIGKHLHLMFVPIVFSLISVLSIVYAIAIYILIKYSILSRYGEEHTVVIDKYERGASVRHWAPADTCEYRYTVNGCEYSVKEKDYARLGRPSCDNVTYLPMSPGISSVFNVNRWEGKKKFWIRFYFLLFNILIGSILAIPVSLVFF